MWKDHLHFELLGEHVLFPGLHLDNFWTFLVASLLTIALCFSERALTYAMTKQWSPSFMKRTRLRKALWKTCLYWVVTLDRLLYMLLAMTFSVGLIMVAVTALSIGQFFIEYIEEPQIDARNQRDSENIKEPLLESPSMYEPPMALHSYPSYRSLSSPTYSHSSPLSTSPMSGHETFSNRSNVNLVRPSSSDSNSQPFVGRPRSKSKPTSIFIHPNESNVARADAAAQQLGLLGDTELVKANQYPAQDTGPWEIGKGKDMARELMGTRKNTL
ncbi:hypothetical protein QCA50_002299 [Cerrena zonata]|uniref:Copper transporter n=1 Tax=Cerrena zonata TaxID=2478898 RepID=A0AAW0GZ31_9APHY